jgi:uncharacterized membrane protein (DUF485 family)
MSDDIIIRGQATLTWSDQFRFVMRKLVQVLWKYAVAMIVLFGLIWALTLPDEQWLALRATPLASLRDFVADAWPFYFGTFAALIVVTIATSYVAFRRLPDVNRKLSYEIDAKGILTKDAADFALMVPWSSIVRTRNTQRFLYLKTVPGAWRYLLWRAFAPADREQILRWATRERAHSPGAI